MFTLNFKCLHQILVHTIFDKITKTNLISLQYSFNRNENNK